MITHCLFALNDGGAFVSNANATISDSRFISNGDIAVRMDSGNVTIHRSEFISNGGGLYSGNGNIEFDSVTFTDNTALDHGGAVSVILTTDTRAEITHCDFTGNTALSGGAVYAAGNLTASGSGDSLIIRDCTFRQNSADSGGAIRARNVNAYFKHCDWDSNTADIGGGIALQADSAKLCRLRGDSLNFAFNQGGEGSALWLRGLAEAPVEVRMTGSAFANNVRSDLPGACLSGRKIRGISGFGPILERCVFYDNENTGGGASAIDLTDAFDATPVELRNLTVVLNTSDSAAVRVRVPAILRNCIVIENGGLREILGNNPMVAYCLTSDTEYHGAGGSFYADPLFADFWGRDFQLTAGSPAINRGDPNALI